MASNCVRLKSPGAKGGVRGEGGSVGGEGGALLEGGALAGTVNANTPPLCCTHATSEGSWVEVLTVGM